MAFYPDKITERFRKPKKAGKPARFSVSASDASFTCGVSLRFYLEIDSATKTIKNAGFKTNGCGYVIAFADFLADRISGERLVNLHGLEDLDNAATEQFGEIPSTRQHCANLCFDALHKTLAQYRSQQLGEWTGEKALICTCFGVSEEAIESAIAKQSLGSVEEIGNCIHAGTGCGSCQLLIQEILDSASLDS